MARIAITGGAGFIGTNLARALVGANHEIVVVDNLSTGYASNLTGLACEFHKTTVTDYRALRRAIKDCEYIYHFAARGSVPRSITDPRSTFEVNAMGTLNVLEVARENGASIAFSSSSSVYGANTERPTHEKMWTSPISPYAASKLSGESLIQGYSAAFKMPVMIYRFFNVFGPWQRPDHSYAAVVPKWIWLLENNEPIEVYGDGEQTRDFTFVEDLIDVLLQGLRDKKSHPFPVNLGFGDSVSLNTLLEILRERYPLMRVIYRDERLGDIRHSQNSPIELKRLFGERRTVDFREAVFKTINWLVENQFRYQKSLEKKK